MKFYPLSKYNLINNSYFLIQTLPFEAKNSHSESWIRERKFLKKNLLLSKDQTAENIYVWMISTQEFPVAKLSVLLIGSMFVGFSIQLLAVQMGAIW